MLNRARRGGRAGPGGPGPRSRGSAARMAGSWGVGLDPWPGAQIGGPVWSALACALTGGPGTGSARAQTWGLGRPSDTSGLAGGGNSGGPGGENQQKTAGRPTGQMINNIEISCPLPGQAGSTDR